MLRLLGKRERWPYEAPGGRVVLRPLHAADVRQVREWLRDLDLVRHAFGLNADASGLERVAEDYCREIRFGRRNVLAIDSVIGEFIGFVRFSLRSGNLGLTARVGILLGPRRLWGRGIGTEAMRLLLDYLFEVRRVESVELDTAVFNERAQCCFEKVGFERRGELTVLPSSTSTSASKIWMELTRERWENLPEPSSEPG